MFRRLTPSRSAYGSLSEVCAPFGVWHLVEKIGPVRHTEVRRKVWCKGTCRKVRLVRRMEACRRHAFFSALAENAVMGPDCMDLGTCCQETPRWGLYSGGYSSALFSENYVTWPFLNLVTPCGLSWAFPSVMRSAERPPCRVFCHLGLETLHGFLVMRFGVRCLRQEIGAVLNITCSMAVSSKSGNTKLVADALQRELTDARVRFVATFDLDGAAAESAQSEGVKGAENAKGAEGSETVENGQSANAAASAPAESTSSTSTLATQASEADVVFVGFWCDKGSCSPAVQHFLQGLAGKRVFLFGTCGFGESDEYFAQILDRVRTYLPADAQYIGGAMCQGKMGVGVKRRYEGMLEKDPENAQARMLIDNWNKAQSHPNEDDFSRIAAAAKEALEGIAE